MQPAQADARGGGSGGNRQLKRWGPIIGVVVVLLVGIGIIVATSGDDDDDDDSVTGGTAATVVTTAAPASTAAPAGTDAPETSGATETSAATDTTTGETDAPDTTGGDTVPGNVDTTAPATTAGPVEITYPLNFSEADEMGIVDQIEWGARCDLETGRLAVPDFFAPQCYAPFEGDNGGATAPGVTAEEINVVYYEGQEGDPIIAYITDAIAVDDTNQQQFETMANVIRYYETYYEMYGRTVNLIPFEGTGGAADEVAARADAARIAAELDPFVVIGGPALTSAFADELAANKVMCISCTPSQPPQFYVDRDPYVFGVDGSAIQKQRHALEFIEKQLIGKPAEYAGEEFVGTTRTFGFIYIESSQASKDLADQYVAGMEAIGNPFVEVLSYESPATLNQTVSQMISRMKAAGVTTIVFSGDPVAPRDFTNEATAQEYYPEWFLSASTLSDVSAFARTYDQEQWSHAYGITTLAARVAPGSQGYRFLYEWFNGEPSPSADTIAVAQPGFAVFFSYVQEAGPNLTHETWRDAIFNFPGTQQAISQPYLSWGDKGYWPEPDYQGIDDATIIWWDPAAVGPDEIQKDGTGLYRYVDGGKRYLPGEWTTDEKLFEMEGSTTIYETPPPGEEPKQYPSPAGG